MAKSIPQWLDDLRDLGVEPFAGSLNSPDDINIALADVTHIYHLAGRVSRDSSEQRLMHEIHIDGTRALCDSAKKADVKKIVLASTSGTIAVTKDGKTIPDESSPAPMEIISRWPYYSSKFYQERVAIERCKGKLKLVIMQPSLILGPGDERLSSTKDVLDFLGRKIPTTPSGGLNFVDVRDTATAFITAMKKGKHGDRYLLGGPNWTFAKFFERLERITKVNAPAVSIPGKLAVWGAKAIESVYRHYDTAPPIEAASVEMAEYFWYLNSAKADKELGFASRDPLETLSDTVTYLRRNFLGNDLFS
jgi:dihydroflavonol-4-reductase